MASIHDATPFAIYEDVEDEEPLSPSDMFEGEMSEISLSRADNSIPHIEIDQEQESEPEPYRSSYTARRPQGRTSGVTHYSFVSALPSESSITSKPISPAIEASEARYTPRKERARFRNSESVRGLQMNSPPLLPAYESSRERVRNSYKAATPSRTGRPETPASRRSASHRGSVRDHNSPRPPPTPQQAPLVLLHVTILPMQVPFSHDMMNRVMPGWLVENYRLLEEKLQDIILMRRGLLIPHPRDEYELLEERILESLELKIPRLLKCGHFVAPVEDSDSETEEDVRSVSDAGTGRGSCMSGGTMTDEHECKEDARDASMCADCHRQLKKPGRGVGAGTRKWDIKIYAANGLMRSEAWGAAWSEMERCDVEISPWYPESVRKTLERRVREEQEADKCKLMYAAEVQRRIEEDAIAQKQLAEQAAEKKLLDDAAQQKHAEEKAEEEKRRYEEALEEKIEEAKESLRLELEAQAAMEADLIAERLRAMEKALQDQMKAAPDAASTDAESSPQQDSRAYSRHPRTATIPLGTLLKNYILALVRDPRNFVILLLTTSLVGMTMNLNLAPLLQLPTPDMVDMVDVVVDTPSEEMLLGSSASVVVTTTATTTATAFATVTFTETATLAAATTSSQTVVEEMVATASAMAADEEHIISIDTTAETKGPSLLPLSLPESHIHALDMCPVENALVPLCAL
ncbi:hypothetical protein P153DRAFT_370706 [Dothidotthia symphoricarpi CBS 119687]|uniref:Pathway-specific nitrogen regulator n=1 Tax=Dothidotthia symphoricarpi CBS 119687 TaxID=1392245 RepID=A0A6A6A1G6_9PLEO|nr:uncharacterized protein P153DRAFT_370706 [Dothidotthia symphoricarpi CBS 119687]KAF2124797.1 hypothetical protein P153DRAFT_370706 [Dothidotthia symphoricarpi CBS 119687]